jgi:spore germination protein KC
MKKTLIVTLLLFLLTGCWDQLPLRNLQLVDIAGFDLEKENGDVLLHLIITTLKGAAQGGGEPNIEMTNLKGPSLVQAIGHGEYLDQAPFLGINTRLYMMSRRFASSNPHKEMAFLLYAPYASINTPLVVYDDDLSELLKTKSGSSENFTKNLNQFIINLKKNAIVTNVTMMQFLHSKEEPLKDIALPILKPTDSGIEFNGALLFHEAKYSGKDLSKEQVRIVMLMLGKDIGRQRYTGKLKGSNEDKEIVYGFSVKKGDSKVTIHQESSRLSKVSIDTQLQIHVFNLGSGPIKPDFVNRMEKELSKHLEEKAIETIKTLQEANCDILGIGQQLEAFHKNIWKSLDWRKDYPKLSIEPNFKVQILNADSP